MTRNGSGCQRQGRGCVYFNFGTAYALHLLVSVHSLRIHYSGSILVFLVRDEHSDALKRDLEQLDVEVAFLERLSKSFDQHRIFEESPFATTLSLDSDILFQGSIDALWEPLEREGVLVTRFFPPPFGIDGTRSSPGKISRVELLDNLRGLLDDEICNRTLRRLVEERIDINIGVFGISRPRGDTFLADWAANMERGRERQIPLLDEMLVVAMVDDYPHFLADEIWNCPADEFFRRTNLGAAKAIHYFGDGNRLFDDQRLGRNPRSWAGRKWYEAYFETADTLDLSRWRLLDRNFDRRVEPPFANDAAFTLRNWLRDAERGVRSVRNLVLDRSYWRRFR